MKAFDKAWSEVKNFFMPEDDGILIDETYPDEMIQEKEEVVRTASTRRSSLVEQAATVSVANGGTETVSGSGHIAINRLGAVRDPYVVRPRQTQVQAQPQKQPEHKGQELKIGVFAPKTFDDVQAMVDEIRELRAVIVNYDLVDAALQRRICDFMNGACYVLDGDVRRVSDNMVLYVPSGVDIDTLSSVAPISFD